jgi:ribonuclease HI
MVAKLCIEMGFQQVQLEGDAQRVVEVVNSLGPDDSGTRHLTEDIRVALRSLTNWETRHIQRDSNMVAHVLANLALKDNMERVWLYD